MLELLIILLLMLLKHRLYNLISLESAIHVQYIVGLASLVPILINDLKFVITIRAKYLLSIFSFGIVVDVDITFQGPWRHSSMLEVFLFTLLRWWYDELVVLLTSLIDVWSHIQSFIVDYDLIVRWTHFTRWVITIPTSPNDHYYLFGFWLLMHWVFVKIECAHVQVVGCNVYLNLFLSSFGTIRYLGYFLCWNSSFYQLIQLLTQSFFFVRSQRLLQLLQLISILE